MKNIKEYIKEFDTEVQYLAFKASSGYNEPNVSYISGDGTVHYNPYDPYNGHDYVEIGGIKWATMNVGANSVTDYGKYFQWGDVSGYTSSQVGTDKVFNWANYKYGQVDWDDETNYGMTKYNATDGKTVLDISDDAARANWGGSWHMPTNTQFQALGTATTSAWTSSYEGSGVAGLVLTSKADANVKLFFPAAGLCNNSGVYSVGSLGRYWSSSLDIYSIPYARDLDIDSSYVSWNGSRYRYYGFTVRPVVG